MNLAQIKHDKISLNIPNVCQLNTRRYLFAQLLNAASGYEYTYIHTYLACTQSSRMRFSIDCSIEFHKWIFHNNKRVECLRHKKIDSNRILNKNLRRFFANIQAFMETEEYVLEEGEPLRLHLLAAVEHCGHIFYVARVVRRDLGEGCLVLIPVLGHVVSAFGHPLRHFLYLNQKV